MNGMALRRSLVLLSALAMLLVLAPTNAVGSAAAKTYRFRVIAVTHTSSSQKSDSPFYTGSSTSTWHLSRVRTISVTVVGGFITGGGYLNVKGVYTAEASTNFGGKPNHCQLSAPTGSQDYPAVAPGRF